MKTLFQNNRSM